ncbi:MAG: hypothetical protein IIU80_01580 [Clostridia bacterium]|jgi:hypothetical protein|nr:hypothetical protein [Clostridia bacterium]
MSDKKAKIKSGIIIAVSIIAIVLSVITLTKAVPTVMLKFADSGTVCDGVLPSVGDELHITDVPEGEIRYLINKQIVFENPYALGDVMLENPESCGYDLQFVIYNTQGEMIYTSPLIKAGQYLEKDKLTAVVKSGVYNCSYSALAYQNGELMGEVNGIVNVTVK